MEKEICERARRADCRALPDRSPQAGERHLTADGSCEVSPPLPAKISLRKARHAWLGIPVTCGSGIRLG